MVSSFWLLENSRKMECGAKQLLVGLVRAAPFALVAFSVGTTQVFLAAAAGQVDDQGRNQKKKTGQKSGVSSTFKMNHKAYFKGEGESVYPGGWLLGSGFGL